MTQISKLIYLAGGGGGGGSGGRGWTIYCSKLVCGASGIGVYQESSGSAGPRGRRRFSWLDGND